MRSILSLGLVAAVTLAAAACGGGGGPSAEADDRPRVVVTTSILGDVVREALGDQADVEVIMPIGADPHEFSPSTRQAEALQDADLLVVNGAGLEQSMADVIDGAGSVFTFADHVALRTLDGNADPHLWNDPHAMAGALAALGSVAAALPGVDRGAVEHQVATFVEQLEALDAEITATLTPIPTARAAIVTNHDSFGYFADRYHLRVIGAVIPSLTTSASASAGDLEALATLVREQQVPAIFAETTQPTKLADALAAEVGSDVVVVELYTESLGEPGSGADTYVGMMRTDAERIAEALALIDYVLDAFSSDLTRRALLGGLLAATTTSLIGTWVVVRGLAFFGEALAHGVLPGIALAAIWGFDLTIGAIVSAVVMVAGINLVNRTTRLPEDTGIGLLFIGMLAVGVVIISREDTYAGDLTAFLFGDVLAVRNAELWLGAIVLVVTLAGVVVGHRAFLALACGRDKAAALGLRPGLAHAAMLALLALAVVSSFRAVGTLLVFGLLVAPPAAASLIARRLPTIMATAVLLGWLSVVVGLTVSYHADTAASASVAGAAVAVFFVVLAASELHRLLRRPRLAR